MNRVCFNMQPLIGKRTGIGWYTYNIINNIHVDDMVMQGMCFDFLGRNHVRQRFDDVNIDNLYINQWIPSKIYKLINGLLPVKYDWFFPKGDIYHYFNFVAPPISKSKKVIITIHDMVYKILPETVNAKTLYILNRDMVRSVKRADVIITVSEHSKKDILRHLPVDEDRIRIVHPGLDYKFYAQGQHPDDEIIDTIRRKYRLPEHYILYLGTIEPRKNLHALINAYELLPDHIRSSYPLVIAGGVGWKAQSMLDHMRTTKSAKNIIQLGYVDESDKPYIYGLADVFTFPSLYEGFGMPIVEAMASGTAVVTANNSSLPEAGGNAALYADAESSQSIADNILRLIENNDYRDALVQKGIRHAKTFSWEKSAEQTVNVYKELMGRR